MTHSVPTIHQLRRSSPAPAGASESLGPATPVGGDSSKASLSCLIVDDSTGFLKAARALLEREGLAVVGVATTAAEGYRLAGALRPDLVLVDIVLGKDSGFELAERLADGPATQGTTVVLISTHSEADFTDLIEESPAAGFLSKAELSARALQRFYGRRSI
jgi:DNA-binding NarL/FixJ family response regulator